jgi:MFS family permease
LKENWSQFALLVLVNAFVGGMVGLERTVVPLIGTQEFRLVLNTAVTSFIVSFGLTKALVNLASGALADRYGRKRVLVLGWLFGVPVPFMLIWAPSWGWVAAANVLLGINQGLCWSMAVVMKIDLAGPKQRGLAVGLNEFAGYLSVGLTALATGYLAAEYGLRPSPFYLGIAYAGLGLLLSWLLVRDTSGHRDLERSSAGQHSSDGKSLAQVFALTSWRNRKLFSASQAGLVNNLNDGMSWGILPLFFAAHGLGVGSIGVLKFLYPAVWGVCQIATGALADRWSRRGMISTGMALQAAALWITAGTRSFESWVFGAVLLGLGTAMVYPTLLAVVGDASAPDWRARSLGVYRFWRDLGYAVGALLAGVVGDVLGLGWAIGIVGGLTLASGVASWIGMNSPRAR